MQTLKNKITTHIFFMNKFFKDVSTKTVGEGNDTPLQYSCLENPMDRGAWWAAVTESRTHD